MRSGAIAGSAFLRSGSRARVDYLAARRRLIHARPAKAVANVA